MLAHEKSLGYYLNRISKIPLLTEDEELSLAQKARGGDEASLEKLITANLKFVVYEAKKYRNRGLDFMDLINEGNTGLVEAAKLYDPGKEVRFISFAKWWIKRRILEAIYDRGSMVRIPQSATRNARKVLTKVKTAELHNSEGLTARELFDTLNLQSTESEDFRRFNSEYVSLDTTRVNGPGEDDIYLSSVLKSTDKPQENTENKILEEKAKKHLENALSQLKVRDKDIVLQYYGFKDGEEKTLREISGVYGISKERVRQLIGKAIRALKDSEEVHKAKECLLDA
jgi:RNA polymerase primary sigma factor